MHSVPRLHVVPLDKTGTHEFELQYSLLLLQSASATHCTQVWLAVQTGVVPLQSLLDKHCTHNPEPALHTGVGGEHVSAHPPVLLETVTLLDVVLVDAVDVVLDEVVPDDVLPDDVPELLVAADVVVLAVTLPFPPCPPALELVDVEVVFPSPAMI